MNENEKIIREVDLNISADDDEESPEAEEPEAEEPEAEEPEAEEPKAEEPDVEAPEEKVGEMAGGDANNSDVTARGCGGEISDAQCRRILSNPMFYAYAKGRAESIAELISGFSEMISLDGGAAIPTEMRATPEPKAAVAEFALSERQKNIARDAGMSYREYYSFLKSMRSM